MQVQLERLICTFLLLTLILKLFNISLRDTQYQSILGIVTLMTFLITWSTLSVILSIALPAFIGFYLFPLLIIRTSLAGYDFLALWDNQQYSNLTGY